MIMASFDLQLLPREEMQRTGGDGDRRYITPIGPLPSVTTVLGQSGDKEALKKWQERVGLEKADKIRDDMAASGKILHDMCENLVLNRPLKPIPMTKQMEFKPFKEILRNNVKTVYGVELPLWSEKLRCAGTADLFATWLPWYASAGINLSAKPTVIDYKGSIRFIQDTNPKLMKYKLQATTYAMCIEERYGMKVDECAIIVLPNQDNPQVFQFNARLYRDQVTEIFETYHKNQTLDALL
jgi:hypothetical protein